ncbi:peptidoglycan DD-metalloendopeptidase family protein [Streptomyces sp. NPDC127040]|uniref:M23 family metallopeptidase n=1 Tax=Streptomyces sp. NPDC127040 TaxID=3347116 RepID=UPI00364E005B
MPGSGNTGVRRRLSLPVTGGYSRATALLRGISHSPATQAPTAEAKEKLVNDHPPSGQYPDTGYDGLTTTTFAGDSSYVSYESQGQGVNYATYGAYETGTYDTTAWTSQDPYLSTIPSQGIPEDTAGQWDAKAWSTQGAEHSGYATEYQTQYQQPGAFGYDTSAEQTGHWAVPDYGTSIGTETGAYDATTWNAVAEPQAPAPSQPEPAYGYEYAQHPEQQQQEQAQQEYAQPGYAQPGYAQDYAYETYEAPAPYAYETPAPATGAVTEADFAETDFAQYSETSVFEVISDATDGPDATDETDAAHAAADGPPAVHDLPTQAMPVTPAPPRSARRSATKGAAAAKAAPRPAGGSSRRRTPAKRSALLTVAVPSACVMGVAGVAAASVGGLTGTEKPAEETTTMAAPDPASVKPVAANTKLDTQLAALSADAGDFADRASRTQERIDLRQRQDEEKKKKAEEAAAKEAARPKFSLPVAQQGLSASYGQSGGMWMSVHTGIDFPVSYGTPVMAATDGTVRTQYNSAYGNMAIVTSADGTETWYCHLSSTKIRGGKVKAGEVIAYSGNSGNSTGPHLHFEVRPGGGASIDPLPWFRNHGLDPT